MPLWSQLINKLRDNYVLTIWHACFNHSSHWIPFPPLFSPLLLHACSSLLLFLPTLEQHEQSGRLMCTQHWSSLLAPLSFFSCIHCPHQSSCHRPRPSDLVRATPLDSTQPQCVKGMMSVSPLSWPALPWEPVTLTGSATSWLCVAIFICIRGSQSQVSLAKQLKQSQWKPSSQRRAQRQRVRNWNLVNSFYLRIRDKKAHHLNKGL